MAKDISPVGLKPQLVGKLVSIQVFDRVSAKEGTIVPESMAKVVGILEGYTLGPKSLFYKIQGYPVGERLFLEDFYVEFYEIER